jgi:hypothetical protein
MNDAKYIGLDVHQATISVAVLDSAGKLVMEAILETKVETILQFIREREGLPLDPAARNPTGGFAYTCIHPRLTELRPTF